MYVNRNINYQKLKEVRKQTTSDNTGTEQLYSHGLFGGDLLVKGCTILWGEGVWKMEINDGEEEEFGFSRNYFLAKEVGGSGKKSTRRISDIDLVDEQVLSPKKIKTIFLIRNNNDTLSILS